MELTDKERKAIIERFPVGGGKEKESFSPSEQTLSLEKDAVESSSEVFDSEQSLLNLLGDSLKNRKEMDDEENNVASQIREKCCNNIRTDLMEGLL